MMLLLTILASSLNIATGDAFVERLDYVSAITAYESVLASEPENTEALWKLARVHIFAGDVAADEERDRHYRESELYARRCVALNDRLADGHVWLAAALGSVAMSEGPKKKVSLAREIKKEIDLALALNPNHDGALTLLGSFNRALNNVSWIERQLADLFLGGLPKGGFEEGEKAFQKAIALRPDMMRHQFELGMLYWEAGRKTEARRWLKSAKELPVSMASDRRRLQKIDRILNGSSE